mmetsp:Transcript_38793/g.50790  ORF Transcript_38793/g.50790 Transcript_38793/m.50790 type:complete len:115 (+) Transcript_38793:494-838(+)
MFFSKKRQLVDIINNLKLKVNSLNEDISREIDVRDTLLSKERDLCRRLKAEVVRAKDVLMSTELSIKAHQVFKKLVVIEDDERIFLDDGSLRDLLTREEAKRQTFEYVKHKNAD